MAQILMLLKLLFFPCLIHLTHSTCAFTQKCNDAPNDCNIPESKTFEPSIYTFTSEFQCPEFAGQPTCCNNDQNELLKSSFNLIGFTFGSDGNGCDVCDANMRRFWCWFTCHPNQTHFVNAYDNINVPNPLSPDQNITVLNVSIKLDPNTACQLYQSCKTTAYVSQVPAMQSDKGLMNFLGSNSISVGKELINMIYTNDPKDSPINASLHQCNETFPNGTDKYGYPVKKNCTCNNCAQSCGIDIGGIVKELSAWDGFDLTVIIVFYCAILGETIICLFVRNFFKKNKKSKKGEGVFIDHSEQKNEEYIK